MRACMRARVCAEINCIFNKRRVTHPCLERPPKHRRHRVMRVRACVCVRNYFGAKICIRRHRQGPGKNRTCTHAQPMCVCVCVVYVHSIRPVWCACFIIVSVSAYSGGRENCAACCVRAPSRSARPTVRDPHTVQSTLLIELSSFSSHPPFPYRIESVYNMLTEWLRSCASAYLVAYNFVGVRRICVLRVR